MMSGGISMHAHDRLLVIVPHPDDETLATGGLIQLALEAGAALRVVIATDGDRNPWPQRWIERRWRIDDTARERWGTRRRREAQVALDTLGVPATSVRHLGWPDGGLTDRLMTDSGNRSLLLAEIEAFAPTLIVAPVLRDRHPDHSALRVMVELALGRMPRAACRCLGFVVHGGSPERDARSVAIDADQQRIKERALDAHASQMRLSAKRMLGIARRIEQFEYGLPSTQGSISSADIHWPAKRRWHHLHDLLFIGESDDATLFQRIRLPRFATSPMVSPVSAASGIATRIAGDRLHVDWTAAGPLQRVFMKIERVGSRLVIYDREGWLVFERGR